MGPVHSTGQSAHGLLPCGRAVQEITDTSPDQQDGMEPAQETVMEHFVHLNTQVQGYWNSDHAIKS